MQLARGFSITGEILRSHWISAYEFSVARFWRLHPKLSRQHVYKSELDKMRNHLAEEVLDKNMLYLMTVGYFLCFTCIPTSNIHEINGIKIIAAISMEILSYKQIVVQCVYCQ